MSKSSTGAGSGMDRKVKNRQDLLRRCMNQFLSIYDGRQMPAAMRDLMRDLACYVRNPPKMRVRKSVECDQFAIWSAATAHFEQGDGRGGAIRAAIESGEKVSLPLRDLAAMRDKIGELSSLCKNLDVEFEA